MRVKLVVQKQMKFNPVLSSIHFIWGIWIAFSLIWLLCINDETIVDSDSETVHGMRKNSKSMVISWGP